jgi:predicted dehydrogenase/threonine dehydrogenase-like Zn-dependent dehydrogenase
MKQLLQNMRDGRTQVVEVPVPAPQAGMVLVQNAASLVSAGTERMLAEFAGKSILGKACSRPDLVKQVADKARREGLLRTIEAAFKRLDQPIALGYSSAGTVVELGEGVEGFKAGQRVACAGGGYAVHAEYVVVPQNLVVPIPDNVDTDSGAFATLGAIALHGFRLGAAQVGENVAVIGLGLLGLLTADIAKAAGCRVIGIDLDPNRVALAQQIGFEAAERPQALEAVMAFTRQRGADTVLVCADSQNSDPVVLAGEIARQRARVVAVGAFGMDIPRKLYYYKELEFIVSRSYGPGRYDTDYEEGGQDYPLGYVRWTAGRNMEGFLDLLAEGKFSLEPIITHRFPIEKASLAYDLIKGEGKQPFIGVLLTYPQVPAEDLTKARKVVMETGRPPTCEVRLGVLGAGLYAGATMLPILKANKDTSLVGIASGQGMSAAHAARKYGFNYACSGEQQVIEDPQVNTLAVLTRHHLHARQVLAGLQAGKNVFCEKPLALTATELEQIETQFQQPDCPLLMVGYNRRFAPMAVRLKAFIDQRREPLIATYRVNAGLIPSDHWTQDPQQGGGRLIGEGCHFVDFLIWLVGALPVSFHVQALPDNGKYRRDNLLLTMTFPDGSLGTLAYLANGDKAFSKERLEVFAGGRVAVLDDYRLLETVYNGRRTMQRSGLRQDKGHKAEWSSFAGAITASGTPPIPYEEILGGMRCVIAAAESLRTGNPNFIQVR